MMARDHFMFQVFQRLSMGGIMPNHSVKSCPDQNQAHTQCNQSYNHYSLSVKYLVTATTKNPVDYSQLLCSNSCVGDRINRQGG